MVYPSSIPLNIQDRRFLQFPGARLRVFENAVLRRMFVPNREVVLGVGDEKIL
jgi:hypothetical protein